MSQFSDLCTNIVEENVKQLDAYEVSFQSFYQYMEAALFVNSVFSLLIRLRVSLKYENYAYPLILNPYPVISFISVRILTMHATQSKRCV